MSKTVVSLLTLSLSCGLSCGGTAPGSDVPPPRGGAVHPTNRAGSVDRAAAAMPAHAIAEVQSGTFGPYVAVGHERTLAVWAASKDAKRHWFGRILNRDGEPQGEVRRISAAAPEVGLAVVRPVGREGGSKGFVIISTSREFGGERIDAIVVGPNGELRGGPTSLAQSLPEVVWIDAVPSGDGAVVLWAVNRGKSATLHAVDLAVTGEVRGSVTDALANARAWQVAPSGTGVAVAAVTSTNETERGGRVELVFLDDKARRTSVVTVQNEPTAEADLDMAAVESGFVLSWSSRFGFDLRVVTAVVDAKGKVVRSAQPLMPPFGPQTLVRVVPSATPDSKTYIAWENLAERPTYGRALRVAALTPGGELGGATGVLTFASSDGGVPDFAATTKGLAAITLAPACRRNDACETAHVVPTFAVFDEQMDGVVSEPIRLEPLGGRPADLVWGLSCGRLQCQALAAEPRSPAQVYNVQLGGLSDAWAPAARRYRPPRPPRAATIETVASSESVSDVAAVRAGERTLLSWVTHFDPSIPYERPKTPAPDGRYAPVRAVLSLLGFGPGRSEAPQIVSYRARSLGGVAIAAASDGSKTALLGWTALDQMEPQVFLTPIAADGRKRNPIMLTRAKGEKEAVSLTDVGDGWFVAWTDARDGNPSVYATKVNRHLVRAFPDRRITQGVANASSVQLLRRGDHVFAVWADARGQERGVSDLYAVRLGIKDGTPSGPEQRLTRTPNNSHSPAVAAFGDGAVIVWIEDQPTADEGDKSTLMLARLDSGAEIAADPVRVTFGGRPRGIGLSCSDRTCRVAANVVGGDVAEVRAFTWEPGRDPEPRRVASLAARPQDPAGPALVEDDLFYADATVDGAVELRRVNVEWTGK